MLRAALRHNQPDTDQFVSAFAGAVSPAAVIGPVPRRCGDAHLAVSQQTHVAAVARAAGRARHHRAGVHQRLDVAELDRLLEDVLATRRHDQSGTGRDLSALHEDATFIVDVTESVDSAKAILAVSAATTLVHALTTRAVDVVLAALLLAGGVIGAQYGALLTLRIKPDLMRLALAVIILLVGLRMFLGLFWRPDEIFSIVYL